MKSLDSKVLVKMPNEKVTKSLMIHTDKLV